MIEHVQVAVVGAGPAGLAAAAAAANAGAKVVVLDENDSPGGQLRYRRDERSTGATSLIAEVTRAGADIRTGAVVWGVFAGRQLGVQHAGRSTTIQADRIILATGSVDRSVAFSGGSLPGVLSARGLLILLHVHGVRPGRRFAIVGSDGGAELRAAIERAGGEIVATVDSFAGLRVSGQEGVERLEIAGRIHGVDIVVVAAGRLPDWELAQMAECPAGYSEALGGFVPALDDAMRTGVDGILIAGDCAGVCGVDEAVADGRLAGATAAADLGFRVDLDAARSAHRANCPNRMITLAGVRPIFDQIDRVAVGSANE